MMVIFVSQCEKNAIAKTRRVLDAFADRIGDNTWRTVITLEGLDAVKKLLRQKASKSTAVSCHLIRSRSRSDLLWVVGNRKKFRNNGVVAVNWTKRSILHNEWQNNWTYISSIQIIVTLAALLHDIGKSSVGFQSKLYGASKYADSYRHEWISLKLFEWMISGCKSDNEWLERFSNIDNYLKDVKSTDISISCNMDKTSIANMPPLAQWIAWLIISHHRLPPFSEVYFSNNKSRMSFKKSTLEIKPSLGKYYDKYLKAFDYWVRNPNSIASSSEKFNASFWKFDELVLHSDLLQKQIKRWSKKALNDATLMQISEQSVVNKLAISDTFLLYISRLSLMFGDYTYSSLLSNDKRRVKVENLGKLAANTDRKTKEIKQSLDEHLLGVAEFAAKFTRNLPFIAKSLPKLKSHKTLEKNSTDSRFKWQDSAYSTMRLWQEPSQEHGFFAVNMASTGCGKTIANAKIFYALSDPKQGARFTVALGLRVLTLQTGLSFRKNLNLDASQLAILVGGQANKKLFELEQGSNDVSKIKAESEEAILEQNHGSESLEELVDGWVDSDIDYNEYDELGLDTILESKKMKDLLYSPVITCTVDHIIQASECKRGGKYIVPMLRLLSSDLILDEPDDFDENDLPALSRLVHLAGLFGSRVLLSSATLTPDMVIGLFKSYRAGRIIFNSSQNKPAPNVVCAWFDEQEKGVFVNQCVNIDDFTNSHNNFAQKRINYLKQQPIRRKAEILPMELNYSNDKVQSFYAALGQTIIDGAINLHNKNNILEPSLKKEVSIGLVRIANIKNIIFIAQELLNNISTPDDVHIHLSCYHARQLLVLRNSLENKLDRILHRSNLNPNIIFSHDEIKQSLGISSAKKHIFIVLATPVAEVGRDHDYDWAIVEPSSMRSIIQLAGRIWRHRQDKVADKVNMLILQYNINYFIRNKDQPIFTKPGFERENSQLASHNVQQLITPEQLNRVDAIARIEQYNNENISTLSDLEHYVMRDVLNNSKLNYVNSYYDDVHTANKAHTHLQQITPFRLGVPHEDWLLIPNLDSDYGFDAFYKEDVYKNKLSNAIPQPQLITKMDYKFTSKNITPWLVSNLNQALEDIGANEKNINLLATQFATVSLKKKRNGWRFHEFFGFVEN